MSLFSNTVMNQNSIAKTKTRMKKSIYFDLVHPYLCLIYVTWNSKKMFLRVLIKSRSNDALEQKESYQCCVCSCMWLHIYIFIHSRFWPIIDDALRKVAYEKKVKVYFMAGCWKHSSLDMLVFLKALNDLHKVSKVEIQVVSVLKPMFLFFYMNNDTVITRL